MKKNYFLLLILLLSLLSATRLSAGLTNKGDFANLVCFVRFADEAEDAVFNKPYSGYQQLFNDEQEGAVSMFNYFKTSSYGQLFWRTKFFPAPQGEKVMSYRSKYERGFYRPYQAGINDSGYKDEIAAAARLQALALELADYLDKNLPSDRVIDADGDGYVDNVTFVFSGNSERSAKALLWPKRMAVVSAPGKEVYIQGKRFVGYVMVFDEANGYDFGSAGLMPIDLNLGLICHESSHSLGTYDLYHVNDNNKPVGVWDLMADQGRSPQQMTVFTKMKYCKWVDAIPTISEPGTYTLNPVNGATKENIAYKIQPIGHDEYFVVEYRKQGLFDSSIPESGLIVYRINPNATGGNVNYNGKTIFDETYVFRPGGSTTEDGTIAKAAFSADNGRTAFGGLAAVKPFYTDGTEAKFAISNITACGETISFTLEKSEKRIVLSDSILSLSGGVNSSASMTVSSDVAWVLSGVPEWLTPSITEGAAGATTLAFTSNSENQSTGNRETTITIADKEGTGVTKSFVIVQKSNTLPEPHALKAKPAAQGIELTWSPVPVGKKVLAEDFENTSNPNGWEIKNHGNRGWHWQEKTTTYKAYDGNYSGAMWSAWDDAHQDETLTSPTLDNVTNLVFQSCHSGMGLYAARNPQEYNVEVSSDNGATWNVLAEIRSLGGQEVRNQYMEVSFDLSKYVSNQMKIRFHAFDKPIDPANPLGLSYNWMVDNIEIYAPGTQQLQGYNIYRNGVLIATAATSSFIDAAPLEGENVYTVTAVTNLGESAPSAPALLSVTAGVRNPAAKAGRIVAVYTLDGIKVGTAMNGLPKGVYIVRKIDVNGKNVMSKVVRN